MYSDLVTIGLAFIEGFALIISPCILPVLPIILTGSWIGDRTRPFGIITGFIVMFSIVTLFSRFLVQSLSLNPDLLRNISFGLLVVFGLILLSSYLTEFFARFTQRLALVGSQSKYVNETQGGFLSGFVFGSLVGIVWTPCAGPILAAVIVQVALQQTTLTSIFVVLSFAIGAGLPMLMIAIFGRKIIEHIHFIKTHTELFRKLLGIIIILSVILLIYGFGVANAYAKENDTTSPQIENALYYPYAVPPIAGIDTWINSPPLTLDSLKGKVILIDFWTYSCINCIRTFPILKNWYAKYHDKGLVIIGIHSPEFEFEKNPDNVKYAVKKYGLLYPIALDNNYTTWRNFENEYWPAQYLIDKSGSVVYKHFGEGGEEVTERNIIALLGMSSHKLINIEQEAYSASQTPETYLGYQRAMRFAGEAGLIQNKTVTYQYPTELPADQWALQGQWTVYADRIVSASAGAAIKLHFNAGKVFAVMGVTLPPGQVTILLNGKSAPVESGKDAVKNIITIKMKELYKIVHLPRPETGIVEIISDRPGLEIYAFTFGN